MTTLNASTLPNDQDETATRDRFGRVELWPNEQRLLVDGQTMSVGPCAFDLLAALMERTGQLVSKDDPLERVWWEWCERLRPLVETAIAAAVVARFWLASSSAAGAHSPIAMEDAQRAIALYRDLDEQMGRLLTWTRLACALAMTGHGDEAKQALMESLRLSTRTPTPTSISGRSPVQCDPCRSYWGALQARCEALLNLAR